MEHVSNLTEDESAPPDGECRASSSNLTPRTPSEAERHARELFARTASAPEYRGLLTFLYVRWHEFNRTLFDGRLVTPHIGIGLCHPRRLSQCRLTTSYGGALARLAGDRPA